MGQEVLDSRNRIGAGPRVHLQSGQRVEIEGAKFTNDGEADVALLQAGLGIGQHLSICVRLLIERGELVEVLPDWSRPSFPLHIIYPPGGLKSARLSAFIDWMLKYWRDSNRLG